MAQKLIDITRLCMHAKYGLDVNIDLEVSNEKHSLKSIGTIAMVYLPMIV